MSRPPLPPVDTPREPVTTIYHGEAVTEDYRWLEEHSRRVEEWTAAQDSRARAHLESLEAYEPVRRRVEEVLKAGSTTYARLTRGGPTYFALKTQPPLQQPFLVALDAVDDLTSERVVVDPNAIDESGATTIDWYVASPDGAWVAVSLSEHGTEDGTLHVYSAAGDLAQPVIPHVNSGTAGGSLAWRHDSQGFWYTRHPAPGTVPDDELGFNQDVWFHRLGSALADDERELSGVFADSRITESFLTASADGRWVMDRAQKGDGGEWQVFVRSQDDGAGWRLVADLRDHCIRAVLGGSSLFLLSVKDAPHGQVLRMDPGGPDVADARVVVPAGTTTIEEIAASAGRLWVVDIDGGPSAMRSFNLDGTGLLTVDLPEICSVDSLAVLGADQVAWAVETFVSPRQWWVQSDADEHPARTTLDTSTPVDFTGIDVERVMASSQDGTQVPINLVSRHDTPRDGSAPAILYGYGGYAISLKPWFEPSWLPWLEQGGVLAIANIRGGGEYGQEWHHAGRLATKQNCFDDFIACGDHLVTSRVTSRERLGLIGGSNGGLLVGAVLTQRPDLATAVVCAVPVLDALRSELSVNGEFNVTEFGTVRDPEMFRAMRAYSPYHNVRDGIPYPAVLFTAGEFDPRVEAHDAKKMTARLQAATSSDQPILLRMESGGHGIGESLDQQVGEVAAYLTFFFDRLVRSRQA